MADWQAFNHDAVNCPNCRPVVFEPGTGRIDARLTRKAEEVWAQTEPHVRIAWHRVTCLNSTGPVDVALARSIVERLHKATLN